MATWHQQQAFRRNGPPAITLPTVVSDPMPGLRSHTVYPTAAEARAALTSGRFQPWEHAFVALPADWQDPS